MLFAWGTARPPPRLAVVLCAQEVRSMTSPLAEVSSLYGYLTIVEDPHGGFLGGALVVNQRGRPVEFHCTDTLLVSRAEEILYGSTLRPYLCCERIGASLLAKISPKVEVVLINQTDLQPLADEATLPVVFVAAGESASRDLNEGELEAELDGGAPATEIPLARVDHLDERVRGEVAGRLATLARYIPLDEPFGRIVDALTEAGRMAPAEEVPRGHVA